MSISTPSQGTHFSDGVRVGPILGSTFTPGENVFAPSVVIPSPIDQLPPGIFTTPMSLLDITPFASNTNAIMGNFIVPAAGYLPINTTSGNLIRVITFQGIPNVIQLDCARNITCEGGVGTVSSDIFVFGWDQYGLPMVEVFTGPTGATITVGKKAFSYIRAIYADTATVGTISVGFGNVFGFPFLLPYANYAFIPMWNDAPNAQVLAGDQKVAQIDTGDVRGTIETITAADGAKRLTINFYNPSGDARNYNLANSGNRLLGIDPLTSTSGSAVIRVHAPNHQLVENEKVTISGAVSFNGILGTQLNITAPVRIVDSDTFLYDSNGVANFPDPGGGGQIFMTPSQGGLYRSTVGRFGVAQYAIPLF